MMKKSLSAMNLFLAASLLAAIPASAEEISEKTALVGTLPDSGKTITLSEITAAQKMWGDAVVAIGKAGDKAHEVAKTAAKKAYSFELGAIQFKPTLASDQPFRPDLEGTLSYFVAGNARYPEDKGFALKPWIKVRFDNHTVKTFGNKAIAMGHYYFTDKSGKETKVEYTKGYVKTDDGRVLLFLQDSHLPYTKS
ncbi:MAG: hypothetical protein AAF514_05960 [Verrucomicrobiota bacterium]